MSDKLHILKNLIIEINFDVTMSGETKLSSKDKNIDMKDKESFKQIVKIENISYKEPNEEEMKSYWEDFILGKKVKKSDEVNYTGSDESELERWRDEFLKAYLGRKGEDIIKRLKSKNLVDNYSNFNPSGKEKEDLLRKVILRLNTINNIENISDFQSKSDIALKDLNYNLVIIDNELTGRTKCFLNNNDMKKEDLQIDKNVLKFLVSKKLDIKKLNTIFQNPNFKKQTNIDIIIRLINHIFSKMYGKGVYSIYRIKDNEYEKENLKVFFIVDNESKNKKQHLVFLSDYIIAFKYDDFGMTVENVSVKRVEREAMARIMEFFVNKNPDKLKVKQESIQKIIRNRFIKYFIR